MIKIIVICDGRNCSYSETLYNYVKGDLPSIYWDHDKDNDFYYCPTCAPKVEEEFENWRN